MNFTLLAHRGFKHDKAENTLEALLYCKKQKFLSIEVDIRHTKDGRLVLFHDSKINVSGDKLEIAELAYSECKKYKNDIVTLEEFLDAAEGFRLINLEIKTKESFLLLNKHIKKLESLSKKTPLWLSSKHFQALIDFKQQDKQFSKYGWVVWPKISDVIAFILNKSQTVDFLVIHKAFNIKLVNQLLTKRFLCLYYPISRREQFLKLKHNNASGGFLDKFELISAQGTHES